MEYLRDKLKAVPQHLKGWLAGAKSATILVTGKTGAGKSSLINGIIGQEVAKEGHELDRGTTEVESFECKYHDVDITIWDSPGLQDGLDKEAEYIKDMQRKGCADSDLVIYCTPMNANRLKQEDIDAICKLTKGLGPSIWKNALFVLTFANRVEPPPVQSEKLTPELIKEKELDHFKKRLAELKKELQEAVISTGVDASTTVSIPVVPAGDKKENDLPDRDNWLSPLWQASILHMKDRSQTAILKSNLQSTKTPDPIPHYCTETEMGYLSIKAAPQHFQEWLAGTKSATILVTGKTGAGKSSLINGIIGQEVAKEGHELDRGTTEVESFECKYHDVDITIWDSPGLQDGLDKEAEYIKDMQRKGCADSDLVIYCTPMNANRLKQEDIDAICKLTKGLGPSIWKNALFVLTFANRVEPPPVRGEKLTSEQRKKKVLDHFKKRLAEWEEKLQDATTKAGVDAKIAARIPVVPAGFDADLPDRDNWLSPLWYESILRMKERSQPALLKANLHRIKLPDQIKPEDFEKPLHEQPIVYIPTPIKYGAPPAALSVIGVLVGGLIAGSLGLAGAPADGLLAYFNSGRRDDIASKKSTKEDS